MTHFFIIVLIVLIGTIGSVSISKMTEALANYKAYKDQKKHHDRTKQKNGMVFNKKTGKLEADQSVILPF